MAFQGGCFSTRMIMSSHLFLKCMQTCMFLHAEPSCYSVVMCQLRKKVALGNSTLTCVLYFQFFMVTVDMHVVVSLTIMEFSCVSSTDDGCGFSKFYHGVCFDFYFAWKQIRHVIELIFLKVEVHVKITILVVYWIRTHRTTTASAIFRAWKILLFYFILKWRSLKWNTNWTDSGDIIQSSA